MDLMYKVQDQAKALYGDQSLDSMFVWWAEYSHWRVWERAFWMLVMFLELDAVYIIIFIMKI